MVAIKQLASNNLYENFNFYSLFYLTKFAGYDGSYVSIPNIMHAVRNTFTPSTLINVIVEIKYPQITLK